MSFLWCEVTLDYILISFRAGREYSYALRGFRVNPHTAALDKVEKWEALVKGPNDVTKIR